jgi:hypothetical protein
LDLPLVMVDGIHLGDSVILVALGIDARGNKHALGLHEGSTENTWVVKALLSDLIERALAADRARLWVIDGGKALRKGITECFGRLALVQRCQEHKRRNVLEHLPDAMRLGTGKALRDAWDATDAAQAAKRLQALANALQAKPPRGCGQPARRPGRDADGSGHGRDGFVVPNAAHNQPDRKPERGDCAPHEKRQALAGRQHGATLGGKRAQAFTAQSGYVAAFQGCCQAPAAQPPGSAARARLGFIRRRRPSAVASAVSTIRRINSVG